MLQQIKKESNICIPGYIKSEDFLYCIYTQHENSKLRFIQINICFTDFLQIFSFINHSYTLRLESEIKNPGGPVSLTISITKATLEGAE